MKKFRPTDPAPTPRPGFGSIRADEILPLREAAQRLGWGNKTIAQAQRDGLKTVMYGRLKYVAGKDVLDFFAKLIEQGDIDHDRGEAAAEQRGAGDA